MTKIDMDALKKSAPRTYRTVIKHLDLDYGQTFGEQDIDLLRLPQFTRGEMLGWLAAQVLKPDVAAPVVEPPKPEPQVDIAAHAREVVAREEAELRRIKDESRGIARLQQYSDEQGLEETPENLAAVQAFINERVHGYWSREIVDAAIANLGPKGTGQLTWRKAEQPAPPQQESKEVLAPLPNGEPRLPLDVPPTNKASKEQAKDWLARTREATGKYLRPTGGFGIRF